MSKNHAGESGSFKHDLGDLAHQAGVVRHDVGDLAHAAIHTARSGASELRDEAMHAVGSAKERLVDTAKDGYAQARHKAADAAKSFKELVVAHPLASIGVAAGAGVIAGLLLRRPRSGS